MTKQEAIEALKSGKKVTHRYFDDHEWVSSNRSGTVYELEDGVTCLSSEFWLYRTDSSYDTDWEIFTETI